MAAYFFDSSSLVKRFAGENGTKRLVHLFREKPQNAIFAARITFVEVSSALARKAHLDDIKAGAEARAAKRLRRLFDNRVNNVEISESLVLDAARLARKHLLRAYDSIQLAAVLEIAFERANARLTEVIFVSADNDLNKAALAEGLKVENPTDHP